MSPRLAILTPNPADMAFGGRWSEVRDRMLPPLAAEGIAVESRSWIDDPATLQGFDLILPLVTWGYHRDHALWVERTRQWADAGLPFQNPPSVLRWNADKRYLGVLQDKNAPVVPTRFVDRVRQADLGAAARDFGAEVLIVKPQVSASAYKTLRLRPGDALDGAPEGPAMIQPYLDAVEGEGELSLIYLDGAFSHAIRKVAAEGDFRVQPEWGGVISRYEPEPEVRAAAERILAAVEEPLLYARVDMVRDQAGRPVLMELELVEPDLYLGFDPGRGGAFGRAVRRAIGGRAAGAPSA
jgi:glutathione synthase/RimK-type ligase-like ATP-grasp enzyme